MEPLPGRTLPPLLSYCVVNTNGREYLLACLDAIERTHPDGVEREVLVLDNASSDGSAEAVRARGGEIELIELERRTGKAENDSTLMRRASGRYCLLLNEDSEPRPGAVAALIDALDADPKAAAATPQLLDSDGAAVPCAWRFPGVGTALAGALFLHRWLTVQSKGRVTRRVDWAQSSALMVRREAAVEIGYMDPAFFVYYDECDFAKRLAEAGWHSLFVPGAEAIHHDQLSTDLAAGLPRDRRIPPQPRPLHAQAPRARGCAGGAGSDGLVLRPARPRRHRPPRPAGATSTGPMPARRCFRGVGKASGTATG